MSYAVYCLTHTQGDHLRIFLSARLPFCHILGKTLHLQELGQGHTYESSKDIALEFLRAYLFASGPVRWKPALFSKVWVDLISYFDPNSTTLEYSLYAPIAFMSGVAQSLKLDDGFEIKRLSVHQVARLATINPTLAGVSLYHRFSLWPIHFFVKRLTFSKQVSGAAFTHGEIPPYVAQLNEEISILRSLFNENLAVPRYALLRDTYPRYRGGGPLTELPWRVRYPTGSMLRRANTQDAMLDSEPSILACVVLAAGRICPPVCEDLQWPGRIHFVRTFCRCRCRSRIFGCTKQNRSQLSVKSKGCTLPC